MDRALRARGAVYYPWPSPGGAAAAGSDEVLVRLVVSFATLESEVSDFLSIVSQHAALGSQL